MYVYESKRNVLVDDMKYGEGKRLIAIIVGRIDVYI